jgi:hypothetical protein
MKRRLMIDVISLEGMHRSLAEKIEQQMYLEKPVCLLKLNCL